MMAATEEGNMASMVMDSKAAPLGEMPWPLAMAFSMDCFGKACFLAAAMRFARRGLRAGSGPKSGYT